jgi:hypothetical protein
MSRLRMNKVVAPAAPAAGKVDMYADSGKRGQLRAKDGDSGLETDVQGPQWAFNNVINGGFLFAQRQVPGTLTTYSQTAARAYAADRWGMSNENASIQYQQVDTIAAVETGIQNRYYGKFKKITNAGKFMISQVLSAQNTADMRGRKVRLQMIMKRTIAASMVVRIGLAQLAAAGTHDVIPGYAAGVPSGTFVSAWGAVGTDPTLGTNLAYITPDTGSEENGSISGSGMSCTLTAAWVRYSCVFTLPIDMKNLIVLIWTNGQPAANDELNVSEVGLYDGPFVVVDYKQQSQIVELKRCQRFFQKSFPIATAPAQSAGLAGAPCAHAVGGAVAAIFGIRYEISMRAAPTLVFFNPAAANAFARNVLKATDATVTTGANGSEGGTMVNVTGLAAWVAGDGIAIHFTADAEI